MAVPMDDQEISRTIRAHEMMHAKVTPVSREPYINRGLASDDALQAAEEARVNFLIKKAGFDVKALDLKEDRLAGEVLAERGDYRGAVYQVAATSGLGGFNRFIAGIKKNKPEWVDSLKQIHRKIQQALRDAEREGDLASTAMSVDGFVRGYAYTESIAQFLEECIEAEERERKREEEEEAERKRRESEESEREEEEEEAEEETPQAIDPPKSKKRDTTRRLKPKKRPGAGDKVRRSWHEIIVKKMTMNAASPGGIGVKKIPSNRGRNPRFPHRALMDPHRRVFERKLKTGKGGIVLLDISASMNLSVGDVRSLVAASPGCTVAAYGIPTRGENLPNLLILAEKGKMVSEIEEEVLHPEGGKRTNGNDGTALHWAVALARANEPIVLVSDGSFHFGPNTISYVGEARESMTKIIDSDKRITWVPNVRYAIKHLEQH
jgi:hypothetical protein